MSEPLFDAEGLFNADYLYFFGDELDERSDGQVGLIWDLLGLEPGMDVLDLACGHGRISNRLAQRGCRVTGLDAEPLFLEHARRDAEARGVRVDYLEGDMRQLPWTGRFDRVINWFTAFGYFTDAENRQVLDQAAGVLRPGGKLLLEMNNYPRLIRNFEVSTLYERGSDLIIDQHDFDPLTSRSLVTHIVIRDGTIRRAPYYVRLFTFTELRGWLLSAGFSAISGHGEDGMPLAFDHRRMLTIAVK